MVPLIYLKRCFTAFQCVMPGLELNLLSTDTVWAMSGLIATARYMSAPTALMYGMEDSSGGALFLAKLGTWVHGCGYWSGVCHVKPLKKILGIVLLGEGEGVFGPVSGNGNTKKKFGVTKISEFELGEKFLLDVLDGLFGFRDQSAIIHKDRNDHSHNFIVQDIHRRVTSQHLEAHVYQCGSKLLVPESTRLLQSI